LARRIFRNSAQVSWDKEIAEHLESKENRPAQEFFPSEEEVEAEAFENYMFEKMCSFDQEYAEKLIEFRGSLRVAPPSVPPVFENPRLAHERTSALWEGLRRVYFGELERDDVPDRRRLPSREVFPNRSTIDDLRREIDELEARIARRRRMTAEDDGHPSLDIGDDDSDDDFPPTSQGEGGSTSRNKGSESCKH
jgi:hypothetical protein